MLNCSSIIRIPWICRSGFRSFASIFLTSSQPSVQAGKFNSCTISGPTGIFNPICSSTNVTGLSYPPPPHPFHHFLFEQAQAGKQHLNSSFAPSRINGLSRTVYASTTQVSFRPPPRFSKARLSFVRFSTGLWPKDKS